MPSNSETWVTLAFAGSVAVDAEYPHMLVVHLTQGGTLLPDRDYYLADTPAYREFRTRYEDYEEKERKRLLLRLWLAVPGSRPLPASYETLFGSIEPGAVRGGLPSREGWRDVTQLRARRARAARH